MNDAPYTRDEIEALNEEAWPERGVYCQRCRNYIPIFDFWGQCWYWKERYNQEIRMKHMLSNSFGLIFWI